MKILTSIRVETNHLTQIIFSTSGLRAVMWIAKLPAIPVAHFGLKLVGCWVPILDGSDICHRVCAHTVLQAVQMPGVCSVYATVHYKEPLKSFEKRRA